MIDEDNFKLVMECEPTHGQIYNFYNLNGDGDQLYKVLGQVKVTGLTTSGIQGLMIGAFNGDQGNTINGVLMERNVLNGTMSTEYTKFSSDGMQRYIAKSPTVGTAYYLIDGLISVNKDMIKQIKFNTAVWQSEKYHGEHQFSGAWDNNHSRVTWLKIYTGPPCSAEGTLKLYKYR